MENTHGKMILEDSRGTHIGPLKLVYQSCSLGKPKAKWRADQVLWQWRTQLVNWLWMGPRASLLDSNGVQEHSCWTLAIGLPVVFFAKQKREVRRWENIVEMKNTTGKMILKGPNGIILVALKLVYQLCFVAMANGKEERRWNAKLPKSCNVPKLRNPPNALSQI